MTVVRMFWVFGSLFLRRRCVDNPHPLLFRFQPLMSGPVGGPNGRDCCDHGILRDGWHCKNVQNSVMDKSKRSVTSEITDCEAPEDRGARTDSNTESGRSEPLSRYQCSHPELRVSRGDGTSERFSIYSSSLDSAKPVESSLVNSSR